jgi:hypothetical protein
MSEISPIRPSGCSLPSCACVSTGCIGVLMTPGATAFTLMPTFAYSIASDLVAALKPPLRQRGEHGRHVGVRVFDQARRDLHDVAAMPLFHLRDSELRDVKEPHKVDTQHSGVISLGILSERLGDEYAGVVDERIDAPEPGQAFGNHTLGRVPVGNVAGHHQDSVIVGRLDRPRRRDHPVIATAICFDKGRAHALRCAGDDGNLSFAAHAVSFILLSHETLVWMPLLCLLPIAS